MSSRLVVVLSISALLIFSLLTTPSLSKPSDSKADSNDDEDLRYLEAEEEFDASLERPKYLDPFHEMDPEDDDDDDEDLGNYDEFEHEDEYSIPKIDDEDVFVLTDGNFSDFIESNQYVMVEFYAPWCGHCQALAPEYAAAATELKEAKVMLAKVDATEESESTEQYEVQGFPTLYFFVDGNPKPYTGQRTKDGIVTWIKKKIGPSIYNITTVEDAERILTSLDKVVLGFLDSLVGPESEELAAASRLEDDVNFYQTVNPDVAKFFHVDPNVKRPALVMLKKEAEKEAHYDGQFIKSAIAEFVLDNKLPLVTTFSRESAPLIFESPIKKQLLLFANSNDFEKLIFVYVEMDNEDVGRPVSDFFGVTGDASKIIGYTGSDDGKKYILDGELTLDKIKVFGEDFMEDKLKPFYKSDPLPETNDEDVKIVVGNNFDELVLDESKDVLLEIYAPWCGHCQALEPIYDKLAEHLHGIDSLVVAKMDGTTNEHPNAKADGFPTILFFPAGNKSFDPITVDADRTVVGFYKFLKKHASIPFKLQKPGSSLTSESSEAKKPESSKAKESINDVRDEL
ncbi:unnamed protein product [Ilex paraguariensis]|uniref:Protein disulfide-isomerase n=1 Tax=Ilex paraguariensis TaxID=185542 RepID=A0ABC8RE42_9AQUA